MNDRPEEDERSGEHCPVCKSAQEDGPCDHHVANFDLTFDGEGELGVGLGGGSLYGRDGLRKLLDQVQSACAHAVFHDRQDAVARLRALEGPLRAYIRNLLQVEADRYESFEDFESDIRCMADDDADTVRELIDSLIHHTGGSFGISHNAIDSMPGNSSSYENWWSEDAEELAKAAELEALRLLEQFNSEFPPDR